MSTSISKKAKDALNALRERGRLSPKEVIRAAKSTASPLHRYFEWNIKKAAAMYNLAIAKSMIRVIRIEYDVTDHGVASTILAPQYLSDPAARGTYRTIESIRGTAKAPTMLEDVLNDVASAKGHLERALAVGLSLGFADKIRRAIKVVTDLRIEIEDSRPHTNGDARRRRGSGDGERPSA